MVVIAGYDLGNGERNGEAWAKYDRERQYKY